MFSDAIIEVVKYFLLLPSCLVRTLVGSSLPHLVYFKFCVNQSCEVRKEEKISCFLLSLNSSPIDELGECAWKGSGAPSTRAECVG